MAMTSLRWLVAASAWLPAVRAGPKREPPYSGSAPQTPGFGLPVEEAGLARRRLAAAVITPRPAPRDLRKRDAYICGYVNGNPTSPYLCRYPKAQCLYTPHETATGCCSCDFLTACLDYPSSDATKTLDMDQTLYCSNSDSPSCAMLVYAYATLGYTTTYTTPYCDSARTTYTVEFVTSSYTSPTTGFAYYPTFTTTPDGGSPSPGPDGGGFDGQDHHHHTPVGAIVGGVVGGIAVLGLLFLGIFLLLRRKKKRGTPSPRSPAMAPVSADPWPEYIPPPGYGAYPDQPSQVGAMPMPGAAPGAFDLQRYSAAASSAGKPSMVSSASRATTGSPPPGGEAFAPYPGPPRNGAVELPTQQGDGQVHELPSTASPFRARSEP